MSEVTKEATAPVTPDATAIDAETPATPAAVTESAIETTTESAEVSRGTRGKVAGGVDGYNLEKQKLLSQKSAPKSAEAAPVTETPATEEIPAAAEVETPPNEAVVETPAGETPPAETTEEDEPETTEKRRIRLAGLKDGHLVAAANEIARAEDISFTEAWERVAPKSAGRTGDTPPAEETGPKLRTRAEVEADIATARKERKDAAASADALEAGAATKMVEAEEKIDSLKAELDEVGRAEVQSAQRAEAAQEAAFEKNVTEWKAKAVKDWPEAGDPKSEFSKRMLELADELEKDADKNLRQIVYDADAPFVIAKMVAKELGVLPSHLRKPGAKPAAPTNQPSTSTATKPAPVNQRAVGRPTAPAVTPASGANRTTTGGGADDLGLDKVHTVRDYTEVKRKLGLRV